MADKQRAEEDGLGVPELSRRTTGRTFRTRISAPRRFLVVMCTAAVATFGGITVAQVGHADPELTLDEVKVKVDELHEEATKAAERYHQASDELAEIELRLAKAQDKVERQEKRLKELITEIGGFAAATYRAGGVDPTMQILLANDPDDYLAKAAVIDAYASQQTEQLNAVAAQRHRLEQDSLLADEQLTRLQAVEADLDAEKAHADEVLAEAQRLLDNLRAEERARLEAEREAELAAARAAAAEQESRTAERDDADDDDPPPAEVPASGRGQVALDFAMAQVGKPYSWGAAGPSAYDCSGLTQSAWAAAGVSLPRSSNQQISVGTRVSWGQMRPGDLIFFYSPISHVGMYAGNGRMVHAVKPGTPVSVVELSGYYQQHFAGSTRPG